MSPKLRNLKKLCRYDASDDCKYLEYEVVPQNKSDYDSPKRYKFRWVKKNS